MAKSRGRPRKYNEDDVLAAAEQVFWLKGYSDTSLDDLSTAMGMNRPSIYRAFGDKKAIYRRIIANAAQRVGAVFSSTMLTDQAIRQRLGAFMLGMLDVYTSDGQARGCPIMSTAITSAPTDSDLQADLKAVIQSVDAKLEQQFQRALDAGELDASAVSPAQRAGLTHAILHSVSIRARAGQNKQELVEFIQRSIPMLVA